jgi:cytidylate kinase
MGRLNKRYICLKLRRRILEKRLVTAKNPIITIDGPIASGKGTVARAVAKALSFHLLDSGAIYRAFALSVINKKINFNEINLLEYEAKVLSLEFQGELVILNGADVTTQIRAESVGMMASTLSALPAVRAAVLERQRDFARAPGLVADGRDMGTIVFPDAALKIYLTTTAQTRAERRTGQLAKQVARASAGNGDAAEPKITDEAFNAVIEKIRQRDAQDKSRAIAPLRPAPDAVVIDNAAHGPQQTVDAVLALWALRCAG